MSDDYRAGIVEGLRRAEAYARKLMGPTDSAGIMWLAFEMMRKWANAEADRIEREGVGDPPNPP